MAFEGAIDYLKLDFAGLDWADLQSPWYPEGRQELSTLFANAFTCDLEDATRDGDETSVILDSPDSVGLVDPMCIVLGTQKGHIPREDKKHYVLFIKAIEGKDGEERFERVGTGYLLGSRIAASGSPVHVQ